MPVKQNPAYLPPVPVGAGKGGFLFVGGLNQDGMKASLTDFTSFANFPGVMSWVKSV